MRLTKDRIMFLIFATLIISLASGLTTYATSYLYDSNEVSYNNTSSGISSDNVQGAIDELYEEANNYSNLRSMIYPVGSIYLSVTDDTVAKVQARFGGTWESFGQGRTLIGVGTGTDSNSTSKTFSINETSGEYNHKLIKNELPKISAGFTLHGQENGTIIYNVSGDMTGTTISGKYKTITTATSGAYSITNPKIQFGNDDYHNNIQPYITVYMYKRTA